MQKYYILHLNIFAESNLGSSELMEREIIYLSVRSLEQEKFYSMGEEAHEA